MIGFVYLVFIIALLILQDSFGLLAIFGALFKPSVFFIAGLFMKSLSDKPNLMNSQKGFVIGWILIFILSSFLITIGIIFVFLCFYTQQPINPRFIFGFGYYFFGSLIASSLIFIRIKRYRIDRTYSNEEPRHVMFLDKIIKFLTFGFSSLFVLIGLFFSYSCIDSGPPAESMPGVGALFFLSSAMVVGMMLHKVKNQRNA